MKSPPLLDNESQRLRALHRLGLLDTESEAVLDSFTKLAATITGMPIALLSLIDHDRQWWKSAIGLSQGGQTSRDLSFCGHAIAGDELFEVEDATCDERFADNPLVTGFPQVVHYAGMPLVLPTGERIGTLCVIESRPGRLDDHSRSVLEHISKTIVRVLLLRESERNLRERVKAEQSLRESEAKFKTITNAMPQMVWSTLPDGYHDYFNLRWHEFTGVPDGESNAQAWSGLLHPDDLGRATAAWLHSCESGEPYEIEYRMRHHSGAYRWVLGRALPVKDADGNIFRWMGTCTDIHDQKVWQEQLEAASRRKDEFLAMLAHELRNPLAPISSAVQTLNLVANDPARVRGLAGLISRQVKHMTSIVDDLLDVSRVDRGLVEIAREVVDLNQVVQNAVEQASPHIRTRKQSLARQLHDQPVHVQGDPVRLVQIVSNLLNNAAKYTQPGGTISAEVSMDANFGHIRVRDNGNGIMPDLLPHVFELFTQGTRTPDRAQGGLGLGLALVKSVVELHGGTVSAESDGHRRGSVFSVSLPLTRQATTANPTPAKTQPFPPAATGTTRSLRIMVVDDNADAAHMMMQWLELQGHHVSVKHDSAQALAAAQHEPAEVYLLDIGLPDMDGYRLAQRLRQQPANHNATLIAITGYGQAEDIELSRQAGFHHHFVKPADPAALEALLAEIAARDRPTN